MSKTQPELMTLAQTIAEELNAFDDHIWTDVNGYTHVTHIQAAEDRRFSLRRTGYYFRIGDRLEIGGSYPRKEGNDGYIFSHDDSPSISVTSSRSPKVKDIKRRFLPRFHELALGRKRQLRST